MRLRFGFGSTPAVSCLVSTLVLSTTLLPAASGAEEKPWAFRSPVRPSVPAVKLQSWVRNPVDAFLLARLEEEGLTPSTEADRVTLIRRVTFDLIGLPPTPEEIDAFVSDHSPDPYERLVDRLLNSPRFGERWATFWLDLVRFAETDGFKADDVRPAAWRYRDYVIRSFNQDKPFDRFVREQLAGDELYPGHTDALVATGFCRHYPDEFNAVNLEQRRQEILTDITDTTCQVFLGLTVGCARCHDHKFDPIKQEDFYRIQAFFAAYHPSDALTADAEEVDRYRGQVRRWEEQTADLRKRLDELEKPFREKAVAKRRGRFSPEYQALLDLPEAERTPLQRQLVRMMVKQVVADEKEVVQAMKPEVKKEWQALAGQMAKHTTLKPPAPPSAMALTDVGPVAPATFLLKRGEWRHPDREVAPGFLSAIEDRSAPISTPAAGARSTGRRGVLANWLTRPDHPLIGRVIVNRLWQHHFGRGLAATPSDFGVQGEPPTHPELLDWLAVELVQRGWGLKAIHRLIVTSAAYRQASRPNPAAREIDPDNHLLWRMNRRRLEGEALRDAMLAVSGLLNTKAGGPSVHPDLPAELGVVRAGWPTSNDIRERSRRSVYVFAKRNLRYPLFRAFDAPDGNETCARRYATTTAPQALMLLNGKIVLDLAEAFARRVQREAGDDAEGVLERAFRLALGRTPDPAERQGLMAFLSRRPEAKGEREAGATDLCHVLFNLNEFLYVD